MIKRDLREGDVIALHEYKAIYFAIPKVANSSLKSVVTDLLEGKIDEQYMKPNWKPYVFRHEAGREYLKKKGILVSPKETDRLKDYRKFCFVRNPFSRLVSCFFQKLKDPDYQDSNFRNGVSASLHAYGKTFFSGMSFSEFVEAVCRIPDHAANAHFKSQYLFVTDRKGNLCVDFIGYFERLEEDFFSIAKILNFPDHIKLPHLLKSNRGDYKDCYNPALIEKVRSRYQQDLLIFNYGFDSFPTRTLNEIG
jgi:hypothetical protein